MTGKHPDHQMVFTWCSKILLPVSQRSSSAVAKRLSDAPYH